MSDWALAIPSFVVTLREGVEAALVVGIVLTVLGQTRRQDLYAWVGAGVLGGMGLSVAGGGLLVVLLQYLSHARPRLQYALEAGFELLAAGLLTWMLLWMTRQGREMAGTVRQQVYQQEQGWGIGLLVLAAVAREGMETVIFIGAQFSQGWLPLVGALAGVMGAVLVGYLLFGWGMRLNLRAFFLVMGGGLLLIVGGLLVSALLHLSKAAAQAGAGLGMLVWDTSRWLPDDQWPGVLLKVLVGYRDHLYLVQLLVYGLFVGLVGALYYRSWVGSAPPANKGAAVQGS
ncbi:iron permease FTR1 [Gloeomargarita lithophora Alchichica-D10]|uniref:Iron permease FTR1 n=1 Tax=Gloeomargarita lithophora Alchichica-D10 TaxID=1188229 RepID=A0A1J0AD80_9CYAN|nr:FTR1 family protein [Gloeomargarita lithophora]APB33864.1 iron permease FTR1 [Gloeomargarita lithophora Alchichica-D10]